jgi:glutamate racemase
MFLGGIGFFDSGVGGLSVLRACMDGLQGLPIYYYGDNLRAPYGNRSIDEIRAYAHEAFHCFEKCKVRAAVVACNTVTSLLIDELRRCYSFPIVGVEPAILPAVKACKHVLVLATKATVASERFQSLLYRAQKLQPAAEIRVVGCGRLAQAVEEGVLQGEMRLDGLLPHAKAEGVVLGCTHYSWIRKEIESFYNAKVFDGNNAVARRLRKVLEEGAAAEEKRLTQAQKIYGLKKLRSLSFLKSKNKRKNSFFRLKKRTNVCKIKSLQALYFLGSGRILNRQFYERMFAFDA